MIQQIKGWHAGNKSFFTPRPFFIYTYPITVFLRPHKKPRLHCSRALHAVQSHFVNILRASRLHLIDFVLFRNFRSENDEIVVHFAMLIYSCR